MSGKTRFHVSSPSALTLRMQLQDLAGNLTSTQTEVAAAPRPTNVVAAAAGARSTPVSRSDSTPPSELQLPKVSPGQGSLEVRPAPGSSASELAVPAEHVPVLQPAPVAHSEPSATHERSPSAGNELIPPWGGTPERGTHLVASSENMPPPVPAS